MGIVSGTGVAKIAPNFAAELFEDSSLDLLTFLPKTDRMAFKRKDPIYFRIQPAEYLCMVTNGLVLVAESESDKATILDFCGPESFLGFPSLSNVANYLEYAEAVTDVEIMKWSRQELADLLIRDVGASLALAKILADNLARANQRIKSFAKEQIPVRLLGLLLNLGETYYDHAGEVTLPHVTHEVLARYLGTTREQVTSTLNRFRERNLLQYKAHGGISFNTAKISMELFGEENFGGR